MRHTYRFLPLTVLLLFRVDASIGDDWCETAQYPRVITGAVTDADGAPLEGALVEWGYYTATPEERESVRTDADGNYRLETSIVDQDYRLGISSPGFVPWRWDAIVPGPVAAPTTVDVQFKPGATVSVQIVDPDGNPLEGLQVTPRTPRNGFPSSFTIPTGGTLLPGANRTVTSNAQGKATLSGLPTLPAGIRTGTRPDGTVVKRNWLTLEINAGDTRVYDANITESEVLSESPVVVRVPSVHMSRLQPRDGVLLGRVIDQETGQPVPDYVVTMRHSSVPLAVNDADGRFVMGGDLSRGRTHEVRVFAAGYAVAVARIPANARGRAVEQTIELERHPSLSCRLVDARTGEPVTGARVLSGTIREGRRLRFEWGEFEQYSDMRYGLNNVLLVVSDDDGRVTIPEPRDAQALLFVLAGGYVRRYLTPRLRPAAGPDGVVSIELQPGVSVTARVLRNTPIGEVVESVHIGHVIDNVQEYLESRHLEESLETVPIDESGRAVFDSLPPGNYRLSLVIRTRNMTFPCYSKTFTISEGERQEVLLGDMPGTIRLFGTADPFAVIFVDPKFPAEISNFAIRADVDGRFELRDLFPGEYEVRVDASSVSRGSFVDPPSRIIQLTEETELPLAAERRDEAEANRRRLLDFIQNQ